MIMSLEQCLILRLKMIEVNTFLKTWNHILIMKESKISLASIFFSRNQPLNYLSISPILQLQEIGFCFKCKKVKIPRAHHCKNCNRCVVRMDHHCPWTGNCIGLYNHKYFILFLIYGVVLALQIFLWQCFIYLPNAFNYDQVNFGSS